MAKTAKNKLPDFGQSASVDATIVANTNSNIKTSGFVPNTTIRADQINTFIKMMTEGMNGLVDALYQQAVAQGEIKATSTASEWQSYLSKGLAQLIKTTKTDNAAIADKLKNARTITLTGDGTGTTTFDGSADASITMNITNSTNATKLRNGKEDSSRYYTVGEASIPTYFKNGIPVQCTQINDTFVKLTYDGTVVSNSSLNDLFKIWSATDPVVVGGLSTYGAAKAALALTDASNGASLNVGSVCRPVYFSAGVPIKCDFLKRIYYGTMTKDADISVYKVSALSDKTNFLALIYLYSSDKSKNIGTMICEFSSGKPAHMSTSLTEQFSNTSSASSIAYANYILYGQNYPSNIVLSVQEVYGDGHTADSSNSAYYIEIYKILGA